MHKFWFIDMPDVIANNRMHLDFVIFWYTFIVNLCIQFFAISKKCPRNGLHINTFQTNPRNFCLSVILSNQYKHFDMLICQQVITKGSEISVFDIIFFA